VDVGTVVDKNLPLAAVKARPFNLMIALVAPEQITTTEFIKMIMWYCSVYDQITSNGWRYNNPVYKLRTGC